MTLDPAPVIPDPTSLIPDPTYLVTTLNYCGLPVVLVIRKVYVINAFHCILQLTKQAEQNRRLHYLYILDVNVNSVTTLEVENREKSSDVSKLVSSSVRNNAVKQ